MPILFIDGDGREKFCHQSREEVSKNASVMDQIKTASILGLADGYLGSSLKASRVSSFFRSFGCFNKILTNTASYYFVTRSIHSLSDGLNIKHWQKEGIHSCPMLWKAIQPNEKSNKQRGRDKSEG